MSASHSRSSEHSDEALLHRLGYAQVLYREMGGFSNFAISFTIISILAGCLTSYFVGFNYGGPVAITWGWLIVGGFSILVAMAMGEIASAMPTAGALYFWASKLGSPAWGWFTGWFNLVGQISVTAAIQYGSAVFTTALLNLWFPGDGAGFIYVFCLGLILSAYTITGFDASAHMSEETRTASRSAALGMVMSVVASVLFGFVLLVAVT